MKQFGPQVKVHIRAMLASNEADSQKIDEPNGTDLSSTKHQAQLQTRHVQLASPNDRTILALICFYIFPFFILGPFLSF